MLLYNMIMKQDAMAPTVLACLNLDTDDIPGYCDAYLGLSDGNPYFGIITTSLGVREEDGVLGKLVDHPKYQDHVHCRIQRNYRTYKFDAPSDIWNSARVAAETLNVSNRPSPLTVYSQRLRELMEDAGR